ncbi:transmembrane protein, putative (macronuclear) [Tetrahymena thermophila SB210]|uniref:Transmembrane protein, putative n=1 Tax=Tetrahymena thermophila (strain SB210) TaxID=312017 RepID=W7XEW8_TETTS|nr:transmembrane protein, putative [Tetrahymena thermophila SB210]EWS76332.1 transmembrane protein, putative [Tetrahymena thermophila SB210]|eukprot:XP_012651116.1 transmembrane protein, putative [Tetrahymena thermophila SB210]
MVESFIYIQGQHFNQQSIIYQILYYLIHLFIIYFLFIKQLFLNIQVVFIQSSLPTYLYQSILAIQISIYFSMYLHRMIDGWIDEWIQVCVLMNMSFFQSMYFIYFCFLFASKIFVNDLIMDKQAFDCFQLFLAIYFTNLILFVYLFYFFIYLFVCQWHFYEDFFDFFYFV